MPRLITNTGGKCGESFPAYAVRITKGSNKESFFALGPGASRSLFRTWTQANQYRKELLEHGVKGKVVKVYCTIQEE